MKVEIIQEAGYEAALLGMGLSFGKTSGVELCALNKEHSEMSYHGENSTLDILHKIAKTLAHKQGGYNKFLESMTVWIDVTAPLYWWKQADTYRMSTKQSESTMHTIMKRKLTEDDFGISEELDYLRSPEDPLDGIIDLLNSYINANNFDAVNALLPHSFLQRRIWCMSYKTLQNIINQRRTHRLSEWKFFCSEVLEQVEHPEFLEAIK